MLVRESDGTLRVKVIEFGLASSSSPKMRMTLWTAWLGVAGTPVLRAQSNCPTG